jgi:BirA family biotin operon repressor/biotin-[acetyl-CoA-carboxylase] ligase
MTARQVSKWDGRTPAQLMKRWKREDVYVYGRVESTNDVARALAESDVPAGAIVVAREQSHGRGRAGRGWYSPAGGLYLSMIFRPDRVENPTLLPVLAGLGVATGLENAFPGLSPRLKWPNDIVADDAKVAGVLCEASWEGATVRHLVVGVGINVKPLSSKAPPELLEIATSLEDVTGHEASLTAAADAVIAGLEAEVEEPPPALDSEQLAAVDRLDWLRDRRVSVETEHADGPVSGVAVGIAPDGALLFRPDRGALRRVKQASVEPES